jgi:hypothetical protein
MNNDEIKKAWYDGIPIFHQGIQYQRISALIYRLDSNKKITTSAELLDKNNNSVMIAKIEDVEGESVNRENTGEVESGTST